MKYPPGDKEIIDYINLVMEILSIEEEVEGEEEEVKGEENGYKEDNWRGLMKDWVEEMVML